MKILSVENDIGIGIDQLKNRLKIEHEEEDQLLQSYIDTSIQIAEHFTNLAIRIKRIEYKTRPVMGKIMLPMLPAMELEKITLENLGVENNDQPLDEVTNQAKLNIEQGCIYIKHNAYCQVIYKCGFAKGNIPYSLQHGILLHACLMYENLLSDSQELEKVFSFYRFFRRINI
jgi:uncharacterized phiE125 gp8 family phage protein